MGGARAKWGAGSFPLPVCSSFQLVTNLGVRGVGRKEKLGGVSGFEGVVKRGGEGLAGKRGVG